MPTQTVLATTEGRIKALEALARRRQANKEIKKTDNVSLPAGSPMYFYCISCNEEIMVPENYISKPSLCPECQSLKELGWLE